MSLSSFFAGILNSENKFAAAAAAPIFLNLILILSLIISYYFKLDFALNLSYGVSLAGLIQLIFLIFFASKFYSPSLILMKKVRKKVKFFLYKLLPSIFRRCNPDKYLNRNNYCIVSSWCNFIFILC